MWSILFGYLPRELVNKHIAKYIQKRSKKTQNTNSETPPMPLSHHTIPNPTHTHTNFSSILPCVPKNPKLSLPFLYNHVSTAQSLKAQHQLPATRTPLTTFTNLTSNARKPPHSSLTMSNRGSMSYLKNMPGTKFSPTTCDCDVTAYWFVQTVLEEYEGW